MLCLYFFTPNYTRKVFLYRENEQIHAQYYKKVVYKFKKIDKTNFSEDKIEQKQMSPGG